MADLVIDADGAVEFIHDDSVSSFVQSVYGTAMVITRASNVEPYSGLGHTQQRYVARVLYSDPDRYNDPSVVSELSCKWFADLTPVLGANFVVLGPFNSRQEALNAEHVWLENNYLNLNSPAKASDE